MWYTVYEKAQSVTSFMNLVIIDLVPVKVRSEDMVCAMVSVQPFTCPVSDTEETIRKEGSFQVSFNRNQTRPALDRFHDSSKVNALCYILEQC